MGRMKELHLQRQEARPLAFKLLMETGYDLDAAHKLGWLRVHEGSLEADGQILCAVIAEVHAEGEPLKGVAVCIPEKLAKDVA